MHKENFEISCLDFCSIYPLANNASVLIAIRLAPFVATAIAIPPEAVTI